MDSVRVGLGIRALRRRRRWSQAELGRRAGVSQSAVSRAERGDADRLTGHTLARIAESVGARVSMRLLWQGEGLDRLLDAAHARVVEVVLQTLAERGWQALPEVTFNRFGERGSIDVLGWHPACRALLVVEVKSVVPDVQAMLAGLDRKARLAPRLASDRGWMVRHVSRLLVLPNDRTSRRRVADHRATFGLAYPARTRAIRRWLVAPDGAIAGILFVPSSQSTTRRHRAGRG